MSKQVPTAAKIRFLESQIELMQKHLAMFDAARPKSDAYFGFQYQEEVLMAILDDYRQKEKTR